MLSARLHGAGLADGEPYRVVNLSESGICLAIGAALRVGDEIAVSVGEIEFVAAQVMWTRRGLAGLRFARTIDVAAARRRRPGAAGPAALSSGWMANIHDVYRARNLGVVSIGRRTPGR